MQDGFMRVATASPALHVADCAHNAGQIVASAQKAADAGAYILVTPQLSITGATCGDLFRQQVLLAAAQDALHSICTQTADLDLLLFVGLPLIHRGKLYNCAAALHKGLVLGLVPKSYLSGGVLDEQRLFSPAFGGVERFETGFLRGVPIGTELLFRCDNLVGLNIGVEIGEDLCVPAPPSIFHAAAGATVVVNLAADEETVTKASRRRALVCCHSARLLCAYLYAGAGYGESTTDCVFSGHQLLAECGQKLAESEPFGAGFAKSEVDLQRIAQARLQNTAFPDAGGEGYLSIGFSLPVTATELTRPINPTPFVPADEKELAARCEAILAIQAAGLQKRLQHVGCKTAVLGVSGGLDSALALLVTARAFRALGLPAENILAITMPGFGTTPRTKSNAERLATALGVTVQTVDITATVRSHFKDIGQAEENTDVVYENAQARVRTLTLMDIANQRDGLVVGTGDLSELALGWATFGGDHMSMYGVNASVPKTLVRSLVSYEASVKPTLHEVLFDILATPVSPELLPAQNGEISQQTEALVGPYELHDFILYYVLRWGFAPGKVFRLATAAFADTYSAADIKKWMKSFYARFFSQQFKRNCLPDGPAIGSVGLSPHTAWHMPSDAVATAWLQAVEAL